MKRSEDACLPGCDVEVSTRQAGSWCTQKDHQDFNLQSGNADGAPSCQINLQCGKAVMKDAPTSLGDQARTPRTTTHTHRQIVLMPRFGSKTIVIRERPVSLPHVRFLDGPSLLDGETA